MDHQMSRQFTIHQGRINTEEVFHYSLLDRKLYILKYHKDMGSQVHLQIFQIKAAFSKHWQ